jgi:hypothetical protein
VQVAPGAPPHKVACFFQESKGKPASVRIYRYPDTDAIASKSFFRSGHRRKPTPPRPGAWRRDEDLVVWR